MADETTSTNMGMPIPGVSLTSGPTWAEDLVACLTILDSHTHVLGNGVPITPSGLNINADLTFQSTNSATNLYKASFASQSAALTGTNFLSFISGNLYVNDGSGNQIPITSAGGVAGSPGSIGSLTSPAAATYTAGSKLFTWTADSGKAAAMDNGAVTIRETNVASAKGITLQSPSSLAADYSLTFMAALPASTLYVACSSSGALSTVTSDTIGSGMTSVGANVIGAAMTSTGANPVAAARTRATGTTVAAGGVAISTACTSFTTTSLTYVDVTNLTITITTSGRPVFLTLIGQNSSTSRLSAEDTGGSSHTGNGATFKIVRDSTTVCFQSVAHLFGSATTTATAIDVPVGALTHIDAVAAGTYTYKVQAASQGAPSRAAVALAQLIAYEL